MLISLKGKTCLVTGASGFIGAHLCQVLIKQGAIVKALLRRPAKGCWDVSFQCKLGEDQIPAEALDSTDIIFHLAGFAHSLSQKSSDDRLYYQTNVEGTRSLLKAAQNCDTGKFIFFSSVKAMGEENDNRLDENTIPHPQTLYGKSKLNAEKLVLESKFVKSATVLRLVMVYGNTNKGNLAKMINAISKSWFPPLPKIENKRSMIHVEDVVQGAILAASNDVSVGKTYILSDGIDYSTRDLYENIKKSMNKRVPLWGTPIMCMKFLAQTGDLLKYITGRRIIFDTDSLQKLIGNSYFSSKKAVSELGFLPKYKLIDSIPDIITSINAK